jgi:hypothetical protein
LRVEYVPVVNVKAVTSKKPIEGQSSLDLMANAVRETIKYAVKPDHMIEDREWFLELTSQLHNTRAIGIGGVLKEYFSEDEPEDLINTEESDDLEVTESDMRFLFAWKENAGRYLKVEPPKDLWTESE